MTTPPFFSLSSFSDKYTVSDSSVSPLPFSLHNYRRKSMELGSREPITAGDDDIYCDIYSHYMQ